MHQNVEWLPTLSRPRIKRLIPTDAGRWHDAQTGPDIIMQLQPKAKDGGVSWCLGSKFRWRSLRIVLTALLGLGYLGMPYREEALTSSDARRDRNAIMSEKNSFRCCYRESTLKLF
jgi:hypothetical protein